VREEGTAALPLLDKDNIKFYNETVGIKVKDRND